MDTRPRDSPINACTPTRGIQPHIIIMRGTTRESKTLVALSDALNRLDFCSAGRDPRRFHYVTSVLMVLIQRRFPSMSGTAQIQIMTIVENAFNFVFKEQIYLHIMQKLLETLLDVLHANSLVSGHIGSKALWDKHIDMATKMYTTFITTEIRQREDDGLTTLSDLPKDVLREILFRLTDHADILNTAKTQSTLYSLAQEDLLWRDLCYFHFSPEQLRQGLPNHECMDDCNWKFSYRKLIKRFGSRQVYTEPLHQCANCNALFWRTHGHPCVMEGREVNDQILLPKSRTIEPEEFLNYF